MYFFSFVCEIKNLDNGNCHQSEIKKKIVPHNDDDINNWQSTPTHTNININLLIKGKQLGFVCVCI